MRWSRRQPATPSAESVRAHAAAAFAGSDEDTDDLTLVAETYLRWAVNAGGPAERAEAFWLGSLATAREAMRRNLPDDSQDVIAQAQTAAIEAGFHFGQQGRVRDAVLAVEQAGAIVVSRLMGGVDADTVAALRVRRQEDLLNNYLSAVQRRADVYRRPVAPGTGQRGDAPGGSVGGRPPGVSGPGVSDRASAQAEVNRLAQDVVAVTGRSLLGEPPDYEAVQYAARAAPLVYLAAAYAGGYALIVRGQGEPIFVELSNFDRLAVTRWAAALGERPLAPSTIQGCVEGLAASLAPRLLDIVGTESDVALIPLGILARLPLTSAFQTAIVERRGSVPQARYLPDARVLGGRRRPWRLDDAQRVLAVEGTASSPSAKALLCRYAGRADHVANASTTEVFTWMPGANLVQFSCRGYNDHHDPLASGLIMRDGTLSVGMMLAHQPTRRQLLVLDGFADNVAGQNCAAGVAGDEEIGLPAALVHAGAAGVVSAQWPVADQPATILLRHFHEQLAAGESAVNALTSAQQRLRTATYRELATSHPDLFSASDEAGIDPDLACYRDPVYWAAFCYTGP